MGTQVEAVLHIHTYMATHKNMMCQPIGGMHAYNCWLIVAHHSYTLYMGLPVIHVYLQCDEPVPGHQSWRAGGLA